jgi:hypothetical protein
MRLTKPRGSSDDGELHTHQRSGEGGPAGSRNEAEQIGQQAHDPHTDCPRRMPRRRRFSLRKDHGGAKKTTSPFRGKQENL